MWSSSGTCGRGSGRGEGQTGSVSASDIGKALSEGELRSQRAASLRSMAPWEEDRLSRGTRTTSWWFSCWSRQKLSAQLSLKSKTSMRCLGFPKHAHGGIGTCELCPRSRQFLPTCWALTQHRRGLALCSGLGVACTGPRPTFTTGGA